MAILPLGYELFRMGYFACLVPNTALAKEASLAYWSHGWAYFRNFETTYQLWIPLAAMLAAAAVLGRRSWKAGDRRSALLMAAPAVGGVLYGVYVTRVGGDFLHARLLLPAVFALALPVSTLPLRDFRFFGPLLIPWAIACVWLARIPIDNVYGIDRGRLDYIALSNNEHPVTVDDYREITWAADMNNLFKQIDGARSNPQLAKASFYSSSASATVRPAQLYPWLDAKTEAVAYRGAIGLCGYVGRQRVYICDCYGLADPFASRLEPGRIDQDGVWHPGRSKPGHEKRLDADWCLARTVSALDGRSPFSVTVGFVVTALGCGELAEIQAATLEPLTWRRFWRNVSLAPRLTRLRIPGDALKARRRFCGKGGPAQGEL
jgi:arabinofuranosyltransferase